MVRDFTGKPIIITRGYNCPKYNAELVKRGITEETSSHPKGKAVDVSAPNSTIRDKFLEGSYEAGFKRRGIYEEHIHLDIDEEKPQNVTWVNLGNLT